MLLLRLCDGLNWEVVGARRCSLYKSATVGISARDRAAMTVEDEAQLGIWSEEAQVETTSSRTDTDT